MQDVTYLTINPGIPDGKLLDLKPLDLSVVDTSANIPSHMLSIVTYADRSVLPSGCSFKHIPVCLSKTVLQNSPSVWGPEFDLLSHRVCLVQSLALFAWD